MVVLFFFWSRLCLEVVNCKNACRNAMSVCLLYTVISQVQTALSFHVMSILANLLYGMIVGHNAGPVDNHWFKSQHQPFLHMSLRPVRRYNHRLDDDNPEHQRSPLPS